MWTLTEVARLAGVSVTAVHQVETGKAPWKTAIRKIAAVLEVTDIVKPSRRKSA
jgi:transcriptional regulator with XRE-family HTH domain